MNTADFRNRQNLAIYLAAAALAVSLASFGRSNSPNPSAHEDNDSWKSERQYPRWSSAAAPGWIARSLPAPTGGRS